MKKKAFILMTDAIIGMIIAILILLIASYYVTKAKEPTLSKLQLVKRGSDITTLLNYQKVLDTRDQSKINSNITNMLAASYDFKIFLNFTGQRTNVSAGNPLIPQTRNLESGRLIYVYSDNNVVKDFYIARYWIWPK